MAYQDMPQGMGQQALQQMGMNQPAQPTRSLLPQTTLSIDEQLAQMKQKFAEQDKKQEEENDLFAPRTQDDPSIYNEQVDDWLTPLQSDTTLPTTMDVGRDSAHYKHFQEAFANDPAVQAIAPAGMAMAQQLRQMMEQDPNFTYDKAMEAAARTLDANAQQIFHDHHGDESKPRTLIHQDVLSGKQRMGGH